MFLQSLDNVWDKNKCPIWLCSGKFRHKTYCNATFGYTVVKKKKMQLLMIV